jgi:RNA polymerase sigma-70 factor (sigma-E family)
LCPWINLFGFAVVFMVGAEQTGGHVDRRQERAFEQFVAVAGDGLLRLAVLLASDQGLGEDAYQETLHRLAARWGRVGSPQAYCRRVLHNVIIDQARTRKRRPAEIRLAEAHDGADPAMTQQAAAVELRPALLGALRALAPQQRAVIVLRYFDDRSEKEVADLLGVSVGTVKSTASRAMAHLRDNLILAGLLELSDTETQRRADHA